MWEHKIFDIFYHIGVRYRFKTPKFLWVGYFWDVRWTFEYNFNEKTDMSFKLENFKNYEFKFD